MLRFLSSFLLLLAVTLTPVGALNWSSLFNSNPNTLAPIAGQSHEEFEESLSRNVVPLSQDKLLGIGQQQHPSTPSSNNASSFDHVADRIRLSREVEWKFNDINALNISGAFGTLLAFGDYDADDHTDLFFLVSDGGAFAISIRVWDPTSRQFEPLPLFPIPKVVGEVVGMTPVDINMDGTLDLLLTWKTSDNTFSIMVFLHHATTRRLEFSWSSEDPTSSQLGFNFKSTVHYAMMDVNFDGALDFVGQMDSTVVPSQYAKSQGRFVWINHSSLKQNVEDPSLLYVPTFWGFGETAQSLIGAIAGSFEAHRLSSPHSSAFLDLNGDCVPDLVLDVTASGQRYLEIWLATLTVAADTVETENRDQRNDSHRHGGVRSTAEPGVAAADRSDASVSDDKATTFSIRNVLPSSLFYSYNSKVTSASPIGTATPAYVLSDQHRLQLPKGTQQISFADVTGDGTVDVVAVVCEVDNIGACAADDRIVVIGNKQIPVCSDFDFRSPSIIGACRPSSSLCEAIDFTWDTDIAASKLNPSFPNPNGRDHPIRHFVGSSRFPLTLRVGDFDSDGYLDLLAVVRGVETGHGEILLLRNTIGDSVMVLPLLEMPFGLMRWLGLTNERNATEDTDAAATYIPHKLLRVPGASVEVATFFDLGDDGRLDVVALTEPVKGGWLSDPTPARLVSFLHGADGRLFIRMTGLSGACGDDCYGSLSHGATFKLSGADLSGSRYSRVLPMLSQSAYSPLQLPHGLIGLGNTNNYIDYLFYGTAYYNPKGNPTRTTSAADREQSSSLIWKDGSYFHRWIAVIPNSFVITNPYPREDPSKWSIHLSVSPSKYFWRILIATAITLVVVGVVICLLDRREKIEDLKERQGFRSHFIAVG